MLTMNAVMNPNRAAMAQPIHPPTVAPTNASSLDTLGWNSDWRSQIGDHDPRLPIDHWMPIVDD
jgi:hypothetical protein